MSVSITLSDNSGTFGGYRLTEGKETFRPNTGLSHDDFEVKFSATNRGGDTVGQYAYPPSTDAIRLKRYLPKGPLNMGYVTSPVTLSASAWRAGVITAVQNGLNVLFWFSVIIKEENGRPVIASNPEQPLPNIVDIVSLAAELRALNLPVAHMVTFGGWGAAHPVTTFSAAQVWSAFKEWNAGIARAGLPGGFVGLDWDLEGADALSSSLNRVTPAELDLMGQVSQLAQRDGYNVSLVPAESYLDPSTSLFDGSLSHEYPEWDRLVKFPYHGHNAYAYLVARYGNTYVPETRQVVDTFDFITIQLYEGYSHMAYAVNQAGVSPVDYLTAWVKQLATGWFVDFASAPEFNLPSQFVAIRPDCLCIGLANGWADNKKTILVKPADAGRAYAVLKQMGLAPRGFAFWNVEYEGSTPPGERDPLFLAAGLNKFLRIRG
jgi:chitinase